MAQIHAVVELAAVLVGIAVPRGLTWMVALFGSRFYSERAYRLLRRPPVGDAKK